MSYLSTLKEQINGVAPRWSSAKTNIRGLPLYADSLLTGISRFSRKTGSIGLVNPDVELYLTTTLQANQNQVITDRFNQWFIPNSYISVNHLEKFRITNITGLTFTLNDKAKVQQEINSPVTLYSVPCIAALDHLAGVTAIQLRSKHPMLTGDRLAFSLLGNIFREITITHVKDLGETNNDYKFTFELTLEKPLPYDLKVDDEVQLRALPAYFSTLLKVPKSPVSARAIGPFLLDFYSGRIQNGITPNVFCTVQFYDIFFNRILSDDPISITQNYPIFQRSFSSDTIMFWNLMAGNFRLANNHAVALCDENGRWGVTYEAQPPIPPGLSWRINVKTNAQVTLRVGFEPNDFQTFDLPAFSDKGIIVTVPEYNTKAIEKFTIVAESPSPEAEIEFGDWTFQGSEVSRIAFNLMVDVDREAVWLGSSLIVKPYYLSADYLFATYDADSQYDSGFVQR